MLKKIAAAAVLAGALAFSAAAPAVLSAGSVADSDRAAVIEAAKPVKQQSTDTTYTTYSGNWPDPM